VARRAERPLVPEEMVLSIGTLMARFPRAVEENAWVGTRWRVGQATIAHVFGGEVTAAELVDRVPERDKQCVVALAVGIVDHHHALAAANVEPGNRGFVGHCFRQPQHIG